MDCFLKTSIDFRDVILEKYKYNERECNVYIFEEKNLLMDILTNRFTHGVDARNIYRKCFKHVGKKINNPSFFEKLKINNYVGIEHLIMRAGLASALYPYSNFIKEIHKVDMKRNYNEKINNFESNINLENNPFRSGCLKDNNVVWIFSDICGASGSTMEKWLKELLRHYELYHNLWDRNLNIIFNLNILTKYAVERIMKICPDYVNIVFLCWGCLFDVLDKEIVLLDGKKIEPYTLINIYNATTHYNNFEYKIVRMLDKVYPKYDIVSKSIPDIVGEAGDKIQDNYRQVLLHDLMEFEALKGLKLEESLWADKIKKVLSQYFDIEFEGKLTRQILTESIKMLIERK